MLVLYFDKYFSYILFCVQISCIFRHQTSKLLVLNAKTHIIKIVETCYITCYQMLYKICTSYINETWYNILFSNRLLKPLNQLHTYSRHVISPNLRLFKYNFQAQNQTRTYKKLYWCLVYIINFIDRKRIVWIFISKDLILTIKLFSGF